MLAAFVLLLAPAAGPPAADAGVLVYGATPGGLAAAVAAARRNPERPVTVVTPYGWIGGMATNGLTHPDFHSFEALTGVFLDFTQRVERHYADKYGPNSQQVRDSFRGTHAGPGVNLKILRAMLAEHPNIHVLTRRRVVSVQTEPTEGGGRRIVSATFEPVADTAFGPYEPAVGPAETLSGAYFVDATYEGDLAAAAGVPFRVGQEGRDEYGEPLAPQTPDDHVQGYNFRLTATRTGAGSTDVPLTPGEKPADGANAAPVEPPPGYDRTDYLPLLETLNSGRVKRIFCDTMSGVGGGFYKAQSPVLPNGKRDLNDVHGTPVRLSLPTINDDWPTADPARRGEIYREHLRHNVGMLYFLQNDPAVPERFAEDARAWGWCRDEYPTNGHLPEQLYVREARRIEGVTTFTQNDVRPERRGDARAKFQPDSIAVGDYGPSSHGTDRRGTRFDGEHLGQYGGGTAPYQVPLGTVLTRDVTNLAVPVACSASHVGFCALRLEPIWAAMGEAAGETIALAEPMNDGAGGPLTAVPVAAVQERLHAAGSATIYVSDVPPDAPLFRAVQWWGSAGGLTALDRDPSREPVKYATRGRRIAGQYHEAFPAHAFEPDAPLTPFVREAWTELAAKIAPNAEGLDDAPTRGEFVRRAWAGREPAGSGVAPSGRD
ncbi:FAD-dependent oxidoreductase [Alienimonas sp. DA493]|uniref:FAD-dependent oxidoreductase n=1 Tax=Alienimonas sp. DA493 TaxID=3373605 RepID=UPI003753F5EC